ncbi:MAG: ACP S-malonyltransferase [Nitriliruptorales bacterium]|nr:ACP S-malonyltransferase [Nitriliruptorales bacterium]
MKTAFLFPGQGSHAVGLGAAWRDSTHRRVLDEVGSAAGLDLLRALDDEATGANTAAAQPAILAASLTAHEALLEQGIEPAYVAGHSLGEVTASVAAGVFELGDGAELVAERGQAMAAACASSPGAMAAILKLGPDELLHVVGQVPGAVIANENAPGQTVVSGTPAAVERVVELARERGGRAMSLEVEGAFHSPAMTPAVVRMESLLRRLPSRNPAVPVVSGVSGQAIEDDAAIRKALVNGILAPVRWVSVQKTLAELGVELLVEVGPGRVLAGMAKRTVPDISIVSVSTPDDVRGLRDRLPELATAGAAR